MSETKGKVISRRGAGDGQDAGANSGDRGIQRLRISEEYGECDRGCTVEDGHRDKTEQCALYLYGRDCLSSTDFLWNWERVVKLKQRTLSLSLSLPLSLSSLSLSIYIRTHTRAHVF